MRKGRKKKLERKSVENEFNANGDLKKAEE